MSHADLAAETFQQGYNCSQSVFATYAEQLGCDRPTALRIATGFGGGMGRMAGTCGVVTGAFMALGLKYGMTDAQDQDVKLRMYEFVQEFAKRFTARQGSIVCKDLLGCDISTHEGHQQAKDQNLFKTRCVELVRTSTEILDEMLS